MRSARVLAFVVLFALRPGLRSQAAQSQTTAERPASPASTLQAEDIPKPVTPRDVPSWNISKDIQTQVSDALKAGDYRRVENIVAALIERKPDSPRMLTFLARVFFMDNKPLNCAIALKKAERLGPLEEPDRYTLALAYVAMKKPDWASQEFEKLKQSNPQNALYPYWQGRIDYDKYAYETALGKFKKALELDPGFVRAYDNLGLCYEGMSDNASAVKNYEKAVTLNRTKTSASPWPPLNYAMLLLKQGLPEQAEPLLREAVSFGPRLPQAHHQLGISLGKQKKYQNAIDELKKAAELDPAFAEPHLTMAHIYREMGETRQSEVEFNMFQTLKEAQKGEGSASAGDKRQ